MSTYTLSDDGLAIPDPTAFGLEGSGLYECRHFKILADEEAGSRRSYHLGRLVIRHIESGRIFAADYSYHEDIGFEWGPGMGDTPPTWTEQMAVQRTTYVPLVRS